MKSIFITSFVIVAAFATIDARPQFIDYQIRSIGDSHEDTFHTGVEPVYVVPSSRNRQPGFRVGNRIGNEIISHDISHDIGHSATNQIVCVNGHCERKHCVNGICRHQVGISNQYDTRPLTSYNYY